MSNHDLLEAYRAMHTGMLEADSRLLDDLLDDGYTLTHMTGYLQPKKKWLAQIDSGQMRYHAYEEQETTTNVDGDTAVLVGRSLVDATIWGSRGTWPLQLTTTYERRSGSWIALTAVATTF